MGVLLMVIAALLVAALPAAAGERVLENAVEVDGAITLAPGPNVEGVVLLQQGEWPASVIRTFHQVPWLDAASIRLRWADLEPRDGEYAWGPFDPLLAEVRRYNAEHPGARRTLHIRVMGGVHCPKWLEGAGVRYYETTQDSPLYIQSNGWGITGSGEPVVSWGHESDFNGAYGQVNLALQALGTNAGGQWHGQGDWIPLVEMAKRYEAAYVELYPPDFMPLDVKHRIVQAFTQTAEDARGSAEGVVPGFLGFRAWIRNRARTLFVREGTVRQRFRAPARSGRVDRLEVAASVPAGTSVEYRVRVPRPDGSWSEWVPNDRVRELPAAPEAEVEALLRTDDGCLTPRIAAMRPVWSWRER